MVPTSLPVYMADVPDYEVKNGQMHVAFGAFDIVMPISVFLCAMARAEAALAKWQLAELERGEAAILQLRPR